MSERRVPGMTSYEGTTLEQVAQANSSGRTPVVFVHGLWLLPNSWDVWGDFFRDAGYAPVLVDWPDDPATVEEARAHPEVLASKTIGQVIAHISGHIAALEQKPVLIGHSLGGLLTLILAGRALAVASVAISPAPFRGVLALRVSALRAAWPVLHNPLNYKRAVTLTADQFRYAFANAVDDGEARHLYDTFMAPAPGAPLFQSATANLNPWTEAQVEATGAGRGPLLIITGEKDNTVPEAIARGAYKRERRNEAATELVQIPGRGHALTVDAGWRGVAETVLGFVKRFA